MAMARRPCSSAFGEVALQLMGDGEIREAGVVGRILETRASNSWMALSAFRLTTR